MWRRLVIMSALAAAIVTPAKADVLSMVTLQGGTLMMEDQSIVASSDLNGVHLVLDSSKSNILFVGTRFEGNMSLTVDGRDYKGLKEVAHELASLSANSPGVRVRECLFYSDDWNMEVR